MEFFIAKRNLNVACVATGAYLGQCPTTSCEDMAEYIATLLRANWNYQILQVTVAEPEIGEGIFRPDNETFVDDVCKVIQDQKRIGGVLWNGN
jgi:hypothetical protein